MPSAALIPPTISTSSRTSCWSKFQNGIHPAASTARSASVDRGGISRQRLTSDALVSSAAGALGTAAPALFQEVSVRSSQLVPLLWPDATDIVSSTVPTVSADAARQAIRNYRTKYPS